MHIMHPLLPRSYKNLCPFKISAPSFIHPDDYVPNVRLLGPFLDEIELLCFESRETSLPSRQTIQELESLAGEFDFTYNIHLPTDLDPGSVKRKVRDHFIERLLRIMDITLPLAASTYILHLPFNDAKSPPSEKGCDIGWQDRIAECFSRLRDAGIQGSLFSVETLDYPLERIEPVLQDYGLGVCLDVGHLILNGISVEKTYSRFSDCIKMIHLHGVQNGKDHQPLDVFDQNYLSGIFFMLRTFTGSVSLEVFSFGHLLASLAVLEHVMAG